MQDFLMQVQAQPLIKLAQANMELLTRFWTSSAMGLRATADPSELFRVMQPDAFAILMQGLTQNYTEFLMAVSQGWMATMSQGQAVLMNQAQESTDNVIGASDARARRGRQAA